MVYKTCRMICRFSFLVLFSRKKKPADAGLRSETLFLSGGSDGAGVCAGAAFNAGFGIDFVLSVSFFDGGNRALSSTGAAADAFIGNFVSHMIPP